MKRKLRSRPKPGPISPPGGRIRITVNLPRALLTFVSSCPGKSKSDKIVGALARLYALETKCPSRVEY